MPIISDGVYKITKPHDLAATVYDASSPPALRRVFLYPFTTGKEQLWTVKNLSNGNVTFQSVLTGQYLGFPGKPIQNELCEQIPNPTQWRIQPTREHGKFHVVVPGGPVDKSELALDISLLMIYPPLTALRPLYLKDVEQAWSFAPQKD